MVDCSLVCMASTEQHLKMMRLLILCLLLMLPAAPAVSEETEASADGGLDDDDEDSSIEKVVRNLHGPGEPAGVKETQDNLILIIIIVAVAVLTLSGAAIITLVLVRRHLHNRQQGIYFVPTEQDQKGAI
ncbi:uncharacterized protein si:dkey-262k9.2 isoform X1 [Pseudoliparis swirei]|uniref:uncharacterized protein si:dkey-262k9.2 isoform X1 n=2 Tax=Pseudoliparis swirei TaxID=2059687 RepID=UPI0024BE172A|nr:uncharacterized protein si:dkey-262k9.2 isoform X1 [Pseudoliparis swirei]